MDVLVGGDRGADGPGDPDGERGAARVELLPARAVRWGRTVLVADVHVGKSATFRRYGLPVPAGELALDLARLAALAHGADRLLVLGDWVHAAPGMEAVEAEVAAWRARVDAEVELVPGNHDRVLPPAAWRMRLRPDGHREGPFRFCHAPSEVGDAYTWAGHLHPALLLGRGRLAERHPCFWLRPRCGVLPAFGTFTGGVAVRAADGERRIGIVDGELLEA